MTMKALRLSGLALAAAALIGSASLAMPGSAQADDQALVPENLFTAIYLHQKCSGHSFSQDEWYRLVELVRDLSPSSPTGEAVVMEMQRSKVKARDMAAFNQCSSQGIQDYLTIYERDLAPSM